MVIGHIAGHGRDAGLDPMQAASAVSGLAGFAGPWVGGLLKDATASYLTPFLTGAAVVGLSALIMALIRPPAPQHQRKAMAP